MWWVVRRVSSEKYPAVTFVFFDLVRDTDREALRLKDSLVLYAKVVEQDIVHQKHVWTIS